MSIGARGRHSTPTPRLRRRYGGGFPEVGERCACGAIFPDEDDVNFCHFCSRRRPSEGGRAAAEQREAGERCVCGELFPDGANFCQYCSRRRPSEGGRKAAEEPEEAARAADQLEGNQPRGIPLEEMDEPAAIKRKGLRRGGPGYKTWLAWVDTAAWFVSKCLEEWEVRASAPSCCTLRIVVGLGASVAVTLAHHLAYPLSASSTGDGGAGAGGEEGMDPGAGASEGHAGWKGGDAHHDLRRHDEREHEMGPVGLTSMEGPGGWQGGDGRHDLRRHDEREHEVGPVGEGDWEGDWAGDRDGARPRGDEHRYDERLREEVQVAEGHVHRLEQRVREMREVAAGLLCRLRALGAAALSWLLSSVCSFLAQLYLAVLIFSIFQRCEDLPGAVDPPACSWMVTRVCPGACNIFARNSTVVQALEAQATDPLATFAEDHFLGWAVKALAVRDPGLLLFVAFCWEFLESALQRALPKFCRCWWNQPVLDALIFDGLGIAFALWICRSRFRWFWAYHSVDADVRHRKATKKWLGKALKSPLGIAVVMVLVLLDLLFTVTVAIVENPSLAPANADTREALLEYCETGSVVVLSLMLLEQILWLICLGLKYLRKPWGVVDLIVVSFSLVIEVSGGWLETLPVRLTTALRLWKLFALFFDVTLLGHLLEEECEALAEPVEEDEIDEATQTEGRWLQRYPRLATLLRVVERFVLDVLRANARSLLGAIAVFLFVVLYDLNLFFFKRQFGLHGLHWFTIVRLVVCGPLLVMGIRDMYRYVYMYKPLGAHADRLISVTYSELLFILKCNRDIFPTRVPSATKGVVMATAFFIVVRLLFAPAPGRPHED